MFYSFIFIFINYDLFFLSKVLVIIKIAAAVISKSLSVISSVVDSVVDLLTSVILIYTHRKIKNRDTYKYPGGYIS
jgi:divalent metal cation (Fe/Co/Zn/Cd) transporter